MIKDVDLALRRYCLWSWYNSTHGLSHSVTFFLYLACFAVSTYDIFIWVYWIPMAYTSSTTYLFTGLKKTLSSCEPKEEWPHAGLYNCNGRDIELSHMKWFNCG